MAKIIHIASLAQPGLEPFVGLTDQQLRNKQDPERGIFIAESPKVIQAALDVGMRPLSILCEERHLEGDAKQILMSCPNELPVFVGSRNLLQSLTGYALTRGVLCAMSRPHPSSILDICTSVAHRIAVIDGVVDTTNIGAIFRSAAALAIDGVLLTPQSCDPLNRRAVRVSMGTVFKVPWAWAPAGWLSWLKETGFVTVAMALREDSLDIDDLILASIPRMAIILGTEGDGLSTNVIADADYVARIPMSAGVDSLNVAAASAVAFWQLRYRSPVKV